MAIMLTHLDRQKFDQIRARWEAAQSVSVNTATMGVRKTSQIGDNSDEKVMGVSRFRRKLSHGLAFISTPLSQRKTTPSRRQLGNTLLTVAAPTEQSAVVSSHDTLPMPAELDGSNNIRTTDEDTKVTPRALLRSRTTSFIPRPARSDSNNSLSAFTSGIDIRPPVPITQSMSRRPSKIPTPSPPPSEEPRSTSPRQYIPQYQSIMLNPNAGLITPSQYPLIFNGSPTSTALRSRTTPNLAGVPTSSPAKGFLALKKPEPKRSHIPSSATRSLVMKENMPINTSRQQRHIRTQTKLHPRSSFVVPAAIPERTSLSPNTPQSKQKSHNSPIGMMVQADAEVVQQTPATSKRISVIEPSALHSSGSVPTDQGTFLAEAQHTDSSRIPPPSPTPNTVARQATRQQKSTPPPAVPKRRNLGTPNGLGGIWRSSRAMAASNHEVSRFSRSQTFHNFGNNLESPPPVPAVPDRYRTPSLSRYFHTPFQASNILGQVRKASKSLQRGYTTGTVKDNMEISGQSDRESIILPPSAATSSSSSSVEYPEMLRPRPCPLMPSSRSLADQRTPWRPDTEVSHSRNDHPWTFSEFHYPGHADIEPYMQVRDYMPPLYWAGRFQSIFDHWRHNAMMAELNSIPTPAGLIGQCKSSEEKMAACYIFTRLHDYCITDQAADSLWEFEYTYRRDHKMLANSDYPLQPSRKQEEQAINRGALGRAVRKLTPRKSSLINLLRVKSWSKDDLAKPDDSSGQTHGTSSESP